MVYVIEMKYIGSGKESEPQFFTIEDKVPCSYYTGEVRLKGWCGNTPEQWSEMAHGEYETIRLARKYIYDTFGDVREMEMENPEPFMLHIFLPPVDEAASLAENSCAF